MLKERFWLKNFCKFMLLLHLYIFSYVTQAFSFVAFVAMKQKTTMVKRMEKN
jgi:hypothetical protein